MKNINVSLNKEQRKETLTGMAKKGENSVNLIVILLVLFSK